MEWGVSAIHRLSQESFGSSNEFRVRVSNTFVAGGMRMARYKQMPLDPSQLMLYGQSVDDAVPKDCDVRGFADVMGCP